MELLSEQQGRHAGSSPGRGFRYKRWSITSKKGTRSQIDLWNDLPAALDFNVLVLNRQRKTLIQPTTILFNVCISRSFTHNYQLGGLP